MFSQFLTWLGDSDRKSIVVGATNMPMMDPAFRREGRFDILVPMLSPDVQARREILDIHLNVVRKVNSRITKKKLDEIAEKTEYWKGNMLEELVKRATRVAFNRGNKTVSDKDMDAAFDDYKVNVKALKEDEQKYIDLAEELTNSKEFLQAIKRSTVASGGGRLKALREV